MVKYNEKLNKKFLTDKSHITIEDCDQLLIEYGFQYRKNSGSHRGYHKKNELPIIVIIPKHTKYVKREYVDKIIKRLNLEV